ncbi:YwmB family TATA-box binding protein [Acetonema longum]|uniref:TATA-box binding protein n=1 Tax=Acetonema longum DSM 6540 TaxID=1009370 RepID=F7NIU3_9FIRM|nr:YwmB family TATA-box binding protein [Acetonema longum]EGO64066.1 hypothetical protein ALO_09979 [Acetonema longum DSM 6540]
MGRREMWFVTLLAVVSLLWVSGLSYRTAFSSRLLADSMRTAGVHVQEAHVNGWAQIALHAGSENRDLEETVHAAMGKLNLDRKQYSVSRHLDQTQRMIRAEYRNDHAQVTAAVQIVGLPAAPERYIVINILAANPGENFSEWENKAEQIIKDMGGLPRISTCLVGWLDGKLERDEWTKRFHTVLNVLDATVVSTMCDGGTVSITGYSPLLQDWLTVEGRRINVNLAMRYSPYDNRTYITIGSPVITREY